MLLQSVHFALASTGHYVPQLARKIVEYNEASPHPFINLKGILVSIVSMHAAAKHEQAAGRLQSNLNPSKKNIDQVGNAVTDNYYDNIGTVTYWWTHAMISDRTYKAILRWCNFSSSSISRPCNRAMSYAMNHEFGDIDQYSIYTPSCAAAAARANATVLRFKNTLVRRRRSSGYDPCTETYAERYYNRMDVQRAMHANTTGIPYRWTACRYPHIQLLFGGCQAI